MSNKILVNARQTDNAGMTGIKRYTDEIFSRLDHSIVEKAYIPEFWSRRMRGQIWDQFVLPTRIDELLWSPSNTGPIFYRRQVLTIHDIIPIDHPEWIPKKNALMHQYMMPPLVKRVQHIITDSEFSKSRIIRQLGIRSNKITVIPLAADPRFTSVGTEDCAKIKQDNNWPERYVLCISNIEHRKNLIRLLQAWELWSSRPKDLKLVIGGAGNLKNFYEKVGKLPQDVEVLGRLEDSLLPKLYSCAELFIYPSIYEGFGLPPLEAMASGVPVITANNTSVPEVVGSAAVMFDPFNVEDILSAMIKVVNNKDLVDEMKEMGLTRAKGFSWNITASLTQQVLEREANR